MKKIVSILLILLLLTGCTNPFKQNSLDNATIYTTVYPISYIIEYLYGDDSVVNSIYPNGVDINNYTLTDKQVSEYAKGNLFIYMGIGHEKEIAKALINKNNNLQIIDATYGLNYKEDIRELWLAPNNFLMLAKNIKDTLVDYLDNTIKEDNITNKYNELYANVSWIDAELRNIAKDSEDAGNNTLVIANNVFKYLENYGFNIISIEDIVASGSDNAVDDLKSKFKNSKYTGILKLESSNTTELIDELVNTDKAKLVEIKDIITNEDVSSDYVSIQYENINAIRNLLLD